MANNNLTHRPMYVRDNLLENINKKKKKGKLLRKIGLPLGIVASLGVSVLGSYAAIKYGEEKIENQLNNLDTKVTTIEKGGPFTYNGIARKLCPEGVDYRNLMDDLSRLNPDISPGEIEYGDKIKVPTQESIDKHY